MKNSQLQQQISEDSKSPWTIAYDKNLTLYSFSLTRQFSVWLNGFKVDSTSFVVLLQTWWTFLFLNGSRGVHLGPSQPCRFHVKLTHFSHRSGRFNGLRESCYYDQSFFSVVLSIKSQYQSIIESQYQKQKHFQPSDQKCLWPSNTKTSKYSCLKELYIASFLHEISKPALNNSVWVASQVSYQIIKQLANIHEFPTDQRFKCFNCFLDLVRWQVVFV